MSAPAAAVVAATIVAAAAAVSVLAQGGQIGGEKAIPVHLRDGEEYARSVGELVDYGRRLFAANWTDQDGGGRPLSKGNGQPLSDRTRPLTGARAFNRISGPDAGSCYGCHNSPFAIPGGRGDVTTNTFELAQRFDFVTFDRRDPKTTAGSVDERGRPVSLQTVGNARATPALLGAGYLEMLARQITRDLQRTRDGLQPGQSRALVSKGVSFGTLARRADGRWDVRAVRGLPPASVVAPTGSGRPSLVVRPWQSGTAVSLREVTNTMLNQHHGIQSTERVGVNVDADGDGVVNEMTRADVTALVLFEATLPVPGQVIANDPIVERAVAAGEQSFARIGCVACHVPALPLDRRAWIYAEPGPGHPRGNARPAAGRARHVDLNDPSLPLPRLTALATDPAVVSVPAFTDFKLHDITDAADATAGEPLNPHARAGTHAFAAGNRTFLTARLWGRGNAPPYFHDGRYTTLREAVLAHAGEAADQRRLFEQLDRGAQDVVIEFLKSLQVLPPGTTARIVDEQHRPTTWPR